ncbi:MAG: AMP-binding protein, partial [Pseudomonadota bacterium]|nr:AMP-binding protein [Pseudomonadota bacterium]
RLALAAGDRLLNPLPLHPMNALSITTTALMLTGGCAVLVDRFSPSGWWRDCTEGRASLIHYLGVMPALLLARPPAAEDRAHAVTRGVGAGVDPDHHAAFEARFGFPLLELWGMTETGRGFIDADEPRAVGTRAFGRPGVPLLGRVLDETGAEAPRGTPGEFQVRAAGPEPRAGFFARYLDNPDATAEAWTADDWFRTGDVVIHGEDDRFRFVERRKNIIRRSGENIAAAEVEACLQSHDAVASAAVLAHPDKLREEEIYACVVLREGLTGDAALARTLFDWCDARLSYFKAPGWLAFRDALPVTGTQKVQKGAIFASGEDPEAAAHDFRDLKRRTRKEPTP